MFPHTLAVPDSGSRDFRFVPFSIPSVAATRLPVFLCCSLREYDVDTMGLKRKRADTTPVSSPTQPHSASGSTPEPTTSTHDPVPAMADETSLELWCLVKGDSEVFDVTPLRKTRITELKRLIWEMAKNGVLRGTDAKDLVLWKVSSEGLANISQLTSYS